jgi:hypothetical protein
MFADIECDSITVPACDKHNTQKSLGDRAVVTAIAMSMDQERKRSATAATQNVMKAMDSLRLDFNKAKNEVALRPFIKEALLRIRLNRSNCVAARPNT